MRESYPGAHLGLEIDVGRGRQACGHRPAVLVAHDGRREAVGPNCMFGALRPGLTGCGEAWAWPAHRAGPS